MTETFKAFVYNHTKQDASAEIQQLSLSDLPDYPVLVEVEYSTLNYKDGLAMTNAVPIARSYPMVGGIDLAGKVMESSDNVYKPGDKVLVNGYGLSEQHWGGYSRYARLKPEWLVRIPDGLDARQCMAIGTAGYTAMLCVLALEDHGVTPASGDILVTGAAGGVGSVAVALLSGLGYRVIASSGRVDSSGDYLKKLGAAELLPREQLSEASPPLGKERWAGVVDSVGSQVLASALSQTAYAGAVAACGLAGGVDLPTSVMPFILRGVSLIGIDSVMAPMSLRERAWKRLASDLDKTLLEQTVTEYALEDLPQLGGQIIAGQVQGRALIRLQ